MGLYRCTARLTMPVALVAAMSVSPVAAQPGRIPGVGPAGEVVQVRGGFQFTEGPAADGHGNLYFSDIPAERIYKLDSAGAIRACFEFSGHANGLMVDTQGNLYITSQLGIQVFSPAGKLLGILAFPEKPANVTFAGPKRKTLYVTARTSLYSVEMEATGHVFPGTVR